jgi:hypothetical protein
MKRQGHDPLDREHQRVDLRRQAVGDEGGFPGLIMDPATMETIGFEKFGGR